MMIKWNRNFCAITDVTIVWSFSVKERCDEFECEVRKKHCECRSAVS